MDEAGWTPRLRAARQRREKLHDALVEVEEAIARPARGRLDVWSRFVSESMAHLRDAFAQHVDGTEGPEGLYEEILQLAPHLAGKLEHLREEHPEIASRIEAQAARVTSGELGTTWDPDEARKDLQRLLGKVGHHRQKGADLVWEAYNLDIGGPG